MLSVLEGDGKGLAHQQRPEADRDVNSNPRKVRPENQSDRTSCIQKTIEGRSLLMVCS